jgi:hypothetical protein
VDQAIVLDGEIEAILDENLVDYIKILPEKVSCEMIIG